MVEEDYVNVETAKLLKENGFDWDCKSKIFYPEPDYDQESPNGVYAPTLQTVIKWIRKKGFHIFVPLEIDYDEDEVGYKWYHDAAYYPEIIRVSDGKIMYDDGSLYAKPEQAYEVAIKYCLENLI